MSADEPAPTTRQELNAELKSLLARAYDNDIQVKGGWECRNGGGYPDWDVVITEVEGKASD